MRSLSEYSSSTSEHELFVFLYERIISKDISTFSALKKFAAPILGNRQSHPVILRAFSLIKRLNWGFFSDISPKTHSKLWRELVIPDNDFPETGDLKRTLQISNLYIIMMDIHGYTRFCMDSRKNISMLHVLDRVMEYEVGRISACCGAISHRERGDEIVTVAATASDALTVALAVIDYFSMTNVVNDPNIQTTRVGDATALPVFKISAGITGGNTTSPLILTEQGCLSGFLLNSGARLQMRANELSPKESKLMIARQVQMNFEKENIIKRCSLARNNNVYFFNTGHIEFKGVTIPSCEVVFNPKDFYKEKYSEEMNSLMDATRENLWTQRIFTDLVHLISKAAKGMPPFAIELSSPIGGRQTINNESLMNSCERAKLAYIDDEDFADAVRTLKTIIDIIEMVPSFDRFILDYLKGIYVKYAKLVDLYEAVIDKQVDSEAEIIFSGDKYSAWVAAKKGALVFDKLREMGRKHPVIKNKKAIWFNIIKQKENEMAFTLHSGKK